MFIWERKILRRTNQKIRELYKESTNTVIKAQRIRWLSNKERMQEGWIPKLITEGNIERKGKPKRIWKTERSERGGSC